MQISHIYTSRITDIQQKENETLAANIYCFKTTANRCAFDNDTAAICIFVKGFRDAPTIVSKMYDKDPKLWLRSSDLLMNSVQHTNWQLHYLLLQSVWCPVMINVLSVDRQVILAATALSSVMAVMNLATLPRTAPTRFLHQEHHATMEDLVQGINIYPHL